MNTNHFKIYELTWCLFKKLNICQLQNDVVIVTIVLLQVRVVEVGPLLDPEGVVLLG